MLALLAALGLCAGVLALLARRREVENEMREEGISVREKKSYLLLREGYITVWVNTLHVLSAAPGGSLLGVARGTRLWFFSPTSGSSGHGSVRPQWCATEPRPDRGKITIMHKNKGQNRMSIHVFCTKFNTVRGG